MEKILVSRCLLGHKVRYDGGASGPFDPLAAWQAEGRVVAICPEVAEGEDFTSAFLDGARQALALVQRHHIRIAILKANSPSCGNLLTHDGTFSGVKVSGEGVTAALLKRHGVQVFSELELPQAAIALTQL